MDADTSPASLPRLPTRARRTRARFCAEALLATNLLLVPPLRLARRNSAHPRATMASQDDCHTYRTRAPSELLRLLSTRLLRAYPDLFRGARQKCEKCTREGADGPSEARSPRRLPGECYRNVRKTRFRRNITSRAKLPPCASISRCSPRDLCNSRGLSR